jgi:hypothetical protein
MHKADKTGALLRKLAFLEFSPCGGPLWQGAGCHFPPRICERTRTWKQHIWKFYEIKLNKKDETAKEKEVSTSSATIKQDINLNAAKKPKDVKTIDNEIK